MLTNFSTVRKSVKHLTNIEKMETDGTFENITKKERLRLTRERDKLQEVLSGIVEMSRMPGFVFVVDIKKEAIAVKEAKRLGVPVIAIVDTNTDPDPIDFPIPANDDALKSVQIITKAIADAVLDGNLRASAKQQAEAQEAAEAAATKAAERKQVKGKE
jgi:small subunit ribosomal protein S2